MKKIKLCLLLLMIIMITGCNKEKEIILVEAEREYSCPKGYTLNSDYFCIKSTTTSALMRYVCPSGYTLYASHCYITGSNLNVTICGSYYREYRGECYPPKVPTLEYYCTSGVLQGTQCVIEQKALPSVLYYCKSGYTRYNENMCQKID